jgi:hemoglobin-like flavoprotein
MDIQESLQQILADSQAPLAGRFYERFFEQHAEMRQFFEGVNLRFQGVMLTMALQLVVQHDREPKPAISEYLKLLGHKHAARSIPTDAYPKFRQSLLSALADFHDGRWDDALQQQWQRALDAAIEIMLEGHARGPLRY